MSLEKNPTTGQTLDHFGPTVEFLTAPQDADNDFCVVKGAIPPGVSLPLHAHHETEDFFIIRGEIEALKQDGAGLHMDNSESGRLHPRACQRTACLSQCQQSSGDLSDHYDQKARTILSGDG